MEKLEVLDRFHVSYKEKNSRLMLVEATWSRPINDQPTVRVIVGHLHNDLAKKQNAVEMTQFWDKLADFCTGGGAGEPQVRIHQ